MVILIINWKGIRLREGWAVRTWAASDDEDPKGAVVVEVKNK